MTARRPRSNGPLPNGRREHPFDFALHGRLAADHFQRIRPDYEVFSYTVKGIVDGLLRAAEINVHSVTCRTKSIESFRQKASKPADDDPSRPKYTRPLTEITDLAAIRVVTFLPKHAKKVAQLVNENFDVVDHPKKGSDGPQGYRSIHYIVRLSSPRAGLPENRPFRRHVVEIQIRTILQHAWAEIEHDVAYKPLTAATPGTRRRFRSLAEVLALADSEFQTICDRAARIDYQRRSRAVQGAVPRRGEGKPSPLLEGALLQDTVPTAPSESNRASGTRKGMRKRR